MHCARAVLKPKPIASLGLLGAILLASGLVRWFVQPGPTLQLAQVRARRDGLRPALAKHAAELFAHMRSNAQAWRVTHDESGKLNWQDQGATLEGEPGVSFGRLTLARLLRWLPIESQL